MTTELAFNAQRDIDPPLWLVCMIGLPLLVAVISMFLRRRKRGN